MLAKYLAEDSANDSYKESEMDKEEEEEETEDSDDKEDKDGEDNDMTMPTPMKKLPVMAATLATASSEKKKPTAK